MIRITLILTAWVMTISAFAQFPGAGAGKQGPPKIGHIYGKIVDSSGASVNEASVMLLQNRFDSVSKKRKDVLLKGVITKSNGEFDFADLPIMGPLKLKISAVGYKAHDQTVAFQMKMNAAAGSRPTGNDPAQAMAAMTSAMNAFDKDLGNIKLAKDDAGTGQHQCDKLQAYDAAGY